MEMLSSQIPMVWPQKNPKRLSKDIAWHKDLLQQGQIQFSKGKVDKGRIMQAIC